MNLFKLAVLLILIVIIITGCSDRRISFDGRESFRNMTDEQREQMMQERQELAAKHVKQKQKEIFVLLEVLEAQMKVLAS